MSSETQPDRDGAERLQRWAAAGGTWHVLALSASKATISLCSCDGGEEMERFTSKEPALLELLRNGVPDGD